MSTERETIDRSRERIRLEIAGAMTTLLSGSLYIVTTGACGTLALWIARATGASGPWAVLLLLVALAAGCMSGILANYALTPTFLKWTFGKPASGTRLIENFVRECMSKCGVEGMDVFVMRPWDGAYRAADLRAMVGGILRGNHAAQRTLFISRACADALDLEELRALVYHELSHIRLSHLYKRGAFAIFSLLGLLALGTTLLVAAALAGFGGALTWASPLVGLGGFAGAFIALRWQSRAQELEADRFAVLELGADPDALARVIHKSSAFHPAFKSSRRKLGVALGLETHPEPDARMQALAELSSARAPAPAPDRAA